MSDYYPLVSIVVITYNSSKYILETLESIKQQTYKNLELIITDDCSKDNTVVLCQDWLDVNKHGFIRTKLIITPHNTGVSANCNRGYQEAQGEWIKCIAADDCLYENCIENYMYFIAKHPYIRICQSRVQAYINHFDEECRVENTYSLPLIMRDNVNITAYDQYKCLCINNLVIAPSVLMSKKMWEQLDGFDENISMCEDWPMWLKVTLHGEKIYYMDIYTVKYRIHSGSIFGGTTSDLLFKRFFKVDSLVYSLYIKPFAPFYIRFINRYNYQIRYVLDKLGMNKRKLLFRFIFYILNLPYRGVFDLLKKY